MNDLEHRRPHRIDDESRVPSELGPDAFNPTARVEERCNRPGVRSRDGLKQRIQHRNYSNPANVFGGQYNLRVHNKSTSVSR
jgi:hypothetical protein